MAIAAETNSWTSGTGVAVKTEIPVIVVPRSMVVETVQVGRVDLWIGTAKTIAIPMTPGPGAGGIIGFMARCAILNIGARGAAVLGSPIQS